MGQGSIWKVTVKSENIEGASLHELPTQSSTGYGEEPQSEPTNELSGEGQDYDEIQDVEEVEHALGSSESQGSAELRFGETAVVRDDRIAHSTASGELIKAEDFSDSSSCSTISPRIKSSQYQSPNLVNNAATARSPSAAAAETVTTHGSLQATQASAGEEKAGGNLVQGSSTDQSACEATQLVATPAENSRERSFDGGVVREDAGMSKRIRASLGEDSSKNENSVAHRQPSDINQPEAGKRSGSVANGSGPLASQDGMSGVQRKSPSNAGATPQSAGPFPPPPNTASEVLRQRTRGASSLPVVSHLGGYVPLTMATPRRQYTDWQEPESGFVRPACGALIPVGYKRLRQSGNGDRTWACPLRSCDLVFGDLEKLGRHFAMVHKDCLLQDEGDGTFSVIAYQRRVAWRNVPLVVSKKAPDDAPEILTSSSAFSAAAAAEGQQTQASIPDISLSRGTSLRDAPEEPPPRGKLDLDMWRYLISVICLGSNKPLPVIQQQCLEALEAIMASKQLARLLRLPKKRNVQWVANGSPREFQTNGQIKALLIQITGRVPAVSCSECFEGRGPFIGCVVPPPPNTVPGQPPSKTNCANCFYWRLDCNQPGKGNQQNFLSGRARGRPPAPEATWNREPGSISRSPTAWQGQTYAGVPDFGMRAGQYGFNGHQAHPTQASHPPPPFPYGQHAPHIPSNVPAPQHYHSLPPQHMVPQQAYGQPPHQTRTIQLNSQQPPGHPANWQMLPPSPAYSNPSPQTYTHPNPHWQASHWEAQSHHPIHSQQQTPSQQRYHPNALTPIPSQVPSSTPTTTAAISQAPKQPPVSSTTRVQSMRSTGTPPSAPPLRQSPSTVARAQSPGRKPTAANKPARDDTPPNIMEVVQLEEWEKAPGRMQSTKSESLDNIAFSRPYLAAGAGHARDGVRVCEEASFFARALRPGASFTFERDEGARRLVSVAMGKLHVQVDGEPIFVLGSHGLFKIRPGAGCVVANEADITAVVHVTSIVVDV